MKKCVHIYALFAVLGIFGCNKGSTSTSSNVHTYCEGFTLNCQNGGKCGEAIVNGQYIDSCDCPQGTTGVTCETIIRDKFLGVWIGSNNPTICGGSSIVHDTIIITANDTSYFTGYEINFEDKHLNGNGSEGILTCLVSTSTTDNCAYTTINQFSFGTGTATACITGYFKDSSSDILIVTRTDQYTNCQSTFTGTKIP